MGLLSLDTLQKLARSLRKMHLDPIVGTGRAFARRIFRDVSMQIDGFSMTTPFGQRAFLHDLATGVNLDSFQWGLFKRSVRLGNVVLDIGAHIGWYTLQAARAAGPAGRVYAFEPDPQNYSTLLKNVHTNGLEGRVVLVPKAVWDRPGRAVFFIDGTSAGARSTSSLVAMPLTMQEEIRVECVSVDDFLATSGSVKVDVVKMDVEGAELRVLKGMERTLAPSGAHLVMFVECNPGALRAAAYTVADLLEQLEEFGFVVMAIDEHNGRFYSPEPAAIEKPLYTNLLCVRERRTLDILAQMSS